VSGQPSPARRCRSQEFKDEPRRSRAWTASLLVRLCARPPAPHPLVVSPPRAAGGHDPRHPWCAPSRLRRSRPLWPLGRGHVASPCCRPPRSAAAQHRLRRDLRVVLPPSGLVHPTPCVGIFARAAPRHRAGHLLTARDDAQQRLFTPLPSPSSTRPARSDVAPCPAGPAPPPTI
jgi:hypothetical protein